MERTELQHGPRLSYSHRRCVQPSTQNGRVCEWVSEQTDARKRVECMQGPWLVDWRAQRIDGNIFHVRIISTPRLITHHHAIVWFLFNIHSKWKGYRLDWWMKCARCVLAASYSPLSNKTIHNNNTSKFNNNNKNNTRTTAAQQQQTEPETDGKNNQLISMCVCFQSQR